MITTVTLWVVWCLIGLCGGYMASRLMLGGRLLAVLVVCGMAGACLGGWLLAEFWPPEPLDVERVQILTLVAAVMGCALAVWLATAIARRTLPPDEGDGGDDD